MNRSAVAKRIFSWHVPAYMGKDFTAIHLPPQTILKVARMLKDGRQIKETQQATGISKNTVRKVKFLIEKGVDVEATSRQKVEQRMKAQDMTKEEAALYPGGKPVRRQKADKEQICFHCNGVNHHYANCPTRFR